MRSRLVPFRFVGANTDTRGAGSSICRRCLHSGVPSPVIARALYRQIIRSCQRIDPLVPLSPFIPPIHVSAPNQVDPDQLDHLASSQGPMAIGRARVSLPPKSDITAAHLTVPIHSAADLLSFFRAIFRLNMSLSTSTSHQKDKISVAFEAIKSLNALKTEIETCRVRRQRHMDNSAVKFRTGQVVQHIRDGWRGVVVGWDRSNYDENATSSATKSSLTNKNYSGFAFTEYELILDASDAVATGLSSEHMTVLESDLRLVEDPHLQRVRNREVWKYFQRFDIKARQFCPKSLKAYEYPMDVAELGTNDSNTSADDHLICESVGEAIKEFAFQLKRIILDESSCPGERGLATLNAIMQRIEVLASGFVMPSSYRFAPETVPSTTKAAFHVRTVTELVAEILEIMSQRRTCKHHRERVRFSVGDIVVHKKYGFRGVVVGWDPKPAFDVSRWDGLQHIEDPTSYPFYHVIPDQSDCLKAFGGERAHRYVCEANLDPCALESRGIDVDLEPGWKRNGSGEAYLAPEEVRFKYGEDIGDDGVTDHCMMLIEQETNKWLLQSQQQAQSSLSAPGNLSLGTLFRLLQIVETQADASFIQDTIKLIRKAHSSLQMYFQLEVGTSMLMVGDLAGASSYFRTLLDSDLGYSECWNKLATCELMLGKLDDAMESFERVLHLDPRHVLALNAKGLIHMERKEYNLAIDCFRQSIAIDPWSPAGSKLNVCLSQVSSFHTGNRKKNLT